jgi:hypothetical protein
MISFWLKPHKKRLARIRPASRSGETRGHGLHPKAFLSESSIDEARVQLFFDPGDHTLAGSPEVIDLLDDNLDVDHSVFVFTRRNPDGVQQPTRLGSIPHEDLEEHETITWSEHPKPATNLTR